MWNVDVMQKIVEEILADAYAGRDAFGTGVEDYTETVREMAGQTEEETAEARGPPEGRFAIERTADEKKYVRADRQVIFGNDPESWSEQLDDYINGKIRRGANVELIAEDGDVLVLTADTAGKVSSIYKGTERLSDEYLEQKFSAGAHIDELAEISRRGKRNAEDENGEHGEKAAGGWNYRTAYFRDWDGAYFKCTISVQIGKDGNAVYNIGKMEKSTFPAVPKALNGSSANGGAQRKENAPVKTVPQQKPEVKVGSFAVDAAEEGEAQRQLEKQNRRLQRQNQRLREQLKLTDIPKRSRKAVEEISRDLRSAYSSKIDKDTLSDRLEALYDEMAQTSSAVTVYERSKAPSWETIRKHAAEVFLMRARKRLTPPAG